MQTRSLSDAERQAVQTALSKLAEELAGAPTSGVELVDRQIEGLRDLASNLAAEVSDAARIQLVKDGPSTRARKTTAKKEKADG